MYWSFSFSISPNEYSGLISFRIKWFDLLAVQGTLKVLLQHHSSKAIILQCSALVVELSHPYVIAGKSIALTIQTVAGKSLSLLFNTLPSLLMDFSGGSAGKESACIEGDLGLILGLGRSPGEGNSYPFQYSALENSYSP